jgi:cation diffusion facilitator family transporter
MSTACPCAPDAHGGDRDPAFRRALVLALALNLIMLAVEVAASLASGSLALFADAVDFLSDSATLAATLFVLGLGLKWRARAALAKGLSMGALGLLVLGGGLWRIAHPDLPDAPVMGGVGAAALAVNLGVAFLLMRHRNGDANRRSAWLCSRNDALGNVAVMIAAVGVALTGTHWPDLALAVLMASVQIVSAVHVVGQASVELAQARTEARAPMPGIAAE